MSEVFRFCASVGTSPQAWGKGDEHALGVVLRRNIPTGVGKRRRRRRRSAPSAEHPHRRGKSSSLALASIRRSEHPHRRGEKIDGLKRRIFLNGTSPQAWGKGSKSNVLQTKIVKVSELYPEQFIKNTIVKEQSKCFQVKAPEDDVQDGGGKGRHRDCRRVETQGIFHHRHRGSVANIR